MKKLLDKLPADAAKRIQQFENEIETVQKKAEAEIKARQEKLAEDKKALEKNNQARRDKLLADLKTLEDKYDKAGQRDESAAIRDRIRQLEPAKEVLAAKSVWKGLWKLEKPLAAEGDYTLTITERQGNTYKGEVESNSGAGFWQVEGTIKGDEIDLRYTKRIRGREDMVGNASVRGKVKEDVIILNFTLLHTGEEGRIELKLEK